jgi:hypothetical protein
MSGKIHLWPQTPVEHDSQTRLSFILELPENEQIEVWYRIDEQPKENILESCDPFVMPSIYIAMLKGVDLHVHGQVSPSLLKNMEELQLIWKMWRPWKYSQVEITDEDEQELQVPHRSKALLAYSGGVDSCYSYWRHRKSLAGRQSHPDLDGLIINGFDIRLNQPEVFQRILTRQREILAHQGSSLLHLTTNLKKIGIYFEDAQSAILASCLMLFAKTYSIGMIAASNIYESLHLPWGTNPLVDRLYSSSYFETIHDGVRNRTEKIKLISEWPEAVRYLRVCMRGKERDINCGKCEKCMRTILEFRILGLGLPECFPEDVNNWQIRRLRYTYPARFLYYKELLDIAKRENIQAPWINAVRVSYLINRSIRFLGTPFKGQFD